MAELIKPDEVLAKLQEQLATATTVRVRRLRDGFVQIIGQKVVYFRNFAAKNPNPMGTDPRPNEIIHLKEYSPLNTFYGIPDIIAAMPSLVGDQLASQYNIDYFENKAVPRYVITVKGAKLSADAEEYFWDAMSLTMSWECPDGHKNSFKVN